MTCHAEERSSSRRSGTPGTPEKGREAGNDDMAIRKIRTDWKGSNPPTHFPSGNKISPKLRKGLKREFIKLGKRKR